jgi:dihydrofolate reductase
MPATYTFDIFCSLDGFGIHRGDWGGYWGKQGPEFLARRAASFEPPQRMVVGANTYRELVEMRAAGGEGSESHDEWVTRMVQTPTTVISNSLDAAPGLPDATVVSGDAVEIVARLKRESDVPLRSNASLTLNRALMAAGLVDRLLVTIFPVITGQTGLRPIFEGAADYDLELLEQRTLDGRTQELVYRPTLHDR